MTFKLYDYLNAKGKNEFKEWCEKLEKSHLIKLNEKLDKLILYGEGLIPNLLSDTPVPGIKKIRVRGNVQLRPLLCRGPVHITEEFTLLMGAKEIGGKWSPADAPKTAKIKKQDVIDDPVRRRRDHENVKK